MSADIASAQGAMTNGANHAAAISAAGEIDTWTLTATAGDYLALHIGEVGADSPFWPWIRLYNPSGVLVGNNWGATAAIIGVAASLTGTYTVLVASADSGNNDTGSYQMTLAKAPGAFGISPGDEGGVLTNGSNHAGSIHRGDLDMWSFSANAGDYLALNVGETGTDLPFWPWMRLVGPNGALIGNNWGAMVSLVNVAAPLTGIYTVIVASADSGYNDSGTYQLTLARAPGAFTISSGDEGGDMANGSNQSGSMHRGDLDMWSFSANAGDYLAINVGESGADLAFWPWLRLVAPNGALVGNNWGARAALVNVSATLTGTYTVLISSADSGYDDTGDYQVTLAKAPGAFVISTGDEGGAMTNGSNHPGSIHRGDSDMWSFPANAGDYLAINIGETGGDLPFWPWIRLVGPNGTLLGSAWSTRATIINVAAPLTGAYTVIVASADSGYDESGTYELTLAKGPGEYTISTGDEGGALTNGANHPGAIDTGDLDMWSFSATAGSGIVLSLGEPGPDLPFWPWLRLIAPNGALIGNHWGALASQVSVSAPLTGTYTVLVSSADNGYDASGDYVLRLASAPASFIVPPGDNGGPMTPATSHPGTIDRADLDQWSFGATTGNAIAISISETGGDSPFWPWIRLYSPSGTLLGSNWGAISASISVTAPTSGSYRIVVASADNGGDDIGTYVLSVTGVIQPPAPNPAGDIAIDFGPSYGLWLRYNEGGTSPYWSQVHSLSPTALASGDSDGNGRTDVIATFQGYGVWIWSNNTSWVQLHPLDATEITTGDLDGNGQDEIVLSFPGYGIWVRYNNSTWSQLHSLTSGGLATGNIDGDINGRQDLVVNFLGYGVYVYMNNATWVQLHTLNATDITTGDLDGNAQDEVVLSFPGYGLWIRHNNSSWSQLHSLNSAGVAIGNIDGDAGLREDVVVSFPGYGVWAWMNGAGWVQLHGLNAPKLAISDLDASGRGDVIMSFPGYGIWLWMNNAGYLQLHSVNPEAFVTGKFDNN